MRKAFSLLEVILAIVVIGIAVSAVPFVINSGSQGVSSLVSQEAVASTRSKLADILEYQWNSGMDSGSIANGAILKTGDTASVDDTYINRKIMLSSPVGGVWISAENISNYDSNSSYSLNQFNNYTSQTTINDNAIIQKGLISLNSKLSVNYVRPEVKSTANARVKHVEFNLMTVSKTTTDALLLDFNTTFEGDNSVVLRAYSFNIGIPE